MKVIIAPFGGLIGAVLGGILWAKIIQWTGSNWGFVAVGIGVLAGIGMLLTCSRAIDPHETRHWIMVSIGAALFAIMGIFVGKYLDVRWNAITQMTEQIIAEEPLLSEEAATSIAETQYSGSSKWELIKERMHWFDLIFAAIAVFAAFYITLNKRLRTIFAQID
ncbi:hypothetical protein F4212_00860 [Candidatus Poribacteria bacterium]|nr:hypothetical protein [Candidatus Poribacteria bacterium]